MGIAHQNAENSVKQAYQEIAERQRIEYELRMSEEKFAKAFRSSPNALVISELEISVMLDINESFESLFGFNRAEVIGRKATEMNFYTTPEHRTQWQQEFMQIGLAFIHSAGDAEECDWCDFCSELYAKCVGCVSFT